MCSTKKRDQFEEKCTALSPVNQKYVIAVATALKFTEEIMNRSWLERGGDQSYNISDES